MTRRAAVICVVITVLLGLFTYFNDRVIRQSMLMNDLMPAIGYGTLILLVIAINPILRRIRESWILNRRELAIICSMTLIAGATAGWGLWGFLPTSIMLPQHEVRVQPSWQKYGAIKDIPPRMAPKITPANENVVLDDYVRSARKGLDHINISDVPWKAWAAPLLFWVPLGLTMAIALIGLALVVHKQWAHHEQLPYPIASFAQSVLPDEGKWTNSVIANRLFWVGIAPIFLILMHNWSVRVFGDYLPQVPLRFDFSAVSELMPTLVKGGGRPLTTPTILLAVVGLSFFLASDVSFSMGVMPWFFCLLYGFLGTYGISVMSGNHMSPRIEASMFFAGYAAIVVMALYNGRYYYMSTMKAGLGLKTGEEVSSDSIWGMRLFLLATILFVFQLVFVGLVWYLAILYTLCAVMVWIGVSRAVAETGAIQIGTQIFPGAILLTFMGPLAVAPKMLIIMYILSTVLLAGPGWTPFAYLIHSFKLGEGSGIKVGSVAKYSAAILLLCTVIAIPAMIYWQYDAGADTQGWPKSLALMPFDNIVEIKTRLKGQDLLETAQNSSTGERFRNLRPSWDCVTAFGLVFVAAILFAVCRLRFVKWPFHPVVFLFLAGWQARYFAFSFLLGWIIKSLVTRYGGSQSYNKLKPLMVGVIAGDLLGRLIPTLFGLAYYAFTGERLIE